MKKSLTLIALAMVAALALCLAGCGSNQNSSSSSTGKSQTSSSKVVVTLKDGTTEDMTAEELCQIADDNSVAFDKKYLGCPIDIIANVISIEGPQRVDGHMMNGGLLKLGSIYLEVEFQKSESDVAASLSKGDTVHATGYITSSFGKNVCVYYYDGPYKAGDSKMLDSTPTHIEKV